jgi:putative transposase
MIAFIDDHREVHGVEPICRMLPIAPSTYHARVAQRADPAKVSPRARQDLVLMEQIRRVHEANFGVYGARKVWRQLGRDGVAVARCTVERLMRRMGLRGAVRGKETRTTVPDKATPCPADKVNRQFRTPHPNALWVSDFTYVATWQGFVYVAFVIDVFARRIVGWRVSRTAHADFVLDALEQALLWSRRCSGAGAALEQALLWSRRCSGAGAARPPSRKGRSHPPQRQGRAIRCDSLHGTAPRGRDRTLGRQRR